MPATNERDLVATVVRLCRTLRDRGIIVTPAESIDAARSLAFVDIGDEAEVRLGLRAVLVSRREDYDAFDAAFDETWRAPAATAGMIPLPGARTDVRRPPQPGAPKPAPVSLQNWMKPGGDIGDELVKVRAASDREALGSRDFASYAAEDDDAFRRLAARIARRLALRKSRRWRAARRGERLDLRRTVRGSLRTGGNLVRLERRSRKVRRTSLVALCDVSGSMELYSRFLLQFLHALQNTFARVETFVFATRLSRITAHLRGVGYRESLRDLGRDVRDWSGGTRIGAAVRGLLDEHASLIDRRTIVLILSDGWDVGDPAVLGEAMRDLSAKAGRIIWLNPLMGAADFAPETRGMQAALPWIDVLAAGHNLESLQGVVRDLVI
jgi:uncharacterized protein